MKGKTYFSYPDIFSSLNHADSFFPILRPNNPVWRKMGVQVNTDYQDVFDKMDGVIVSVPHRFHYPITMDFLRKGVHLLHEKPLADSPDKAGEMLEQAIKSGSPSPPNTPSVYSLLI
jgi:hypothetical protein